MASTQGQSVRHVLDDGPSRESLVDGLKYAFPDDINSAREVWFRSDGGLLLRGSVQGLIHESGTGHNFHVLGRLLGTGKGNVRSSMGRSNYIRGYYDARKRSGFLYVGSSDLWKL